MQAVNALHGDGAGAFALNLSAHLPQTMRQIDDLWLARGVLQDGGAFGQGGGHQRVLGRADRNKGKLDDRALQPPAGRLGMNIALAQV